ncbi:MAG: FtsQ-type POTRA domain-containing protein, partial [Proteobacteria bacterium]|nr:FtsQ-type POTRA domain-containing protein [Pseudomonadota bacterium]
EDVASLSGVRKGQNLFWMSVQEIYVKLVEEPWVREAAVRRRLPNTLYIYVEEHRPAAIISSGGFFYVDRDSTVVKRVEPGDEKDMPLITGVEMNGGSLSDEGKQRVAAALDLIDAYQRSNFGNRYGLAEAHYDEVTGYSVFTRREPMQLLIGQTDFVERMRKVDRIEAAIAARQGRVQYMLADEDGRIIVKYRPA